MRDPGPGSWIDNGFDVQEQEPVAVPVRITANDELAYNDKRRRAVRYQQMESQA